MTPAKIHETFVTAFRTNDGEQMGNLEYHMQQGTHVCCGNEAGMYFDNKGGG